MTEGWTYGPERNDTLKQHLCLMPYEELPESEKQYDRNSGPEHPEAHHETGLQHFAVSTAATDRRLSTVEEKRRRIFFPSAILY